MLLTWQGGLGLPDREYYFLEDAKSKEIELQKEYYSKYTKVLPVKKVALLYQSEYQFKKELLKRIKDKK